MAGCELDAIAGLFVAVFEGEFGDAGFVEFAEAFRDHPVVLFLCCVGERQVETESGAEAKTFGKPGSVDVHHHVNQRFHLGGFPAFPTKRIWAASSFKIGSAFRNASSFPPHIR